MVRCIVVVEDEPDVLSLIRDLLELDGYRVVGVETPELALTALGGIVPDLFLIDMMLPKMSGIELATQLRAQGYPTTPMVGMSASRLMTQLAAQSPNFSQVMAKPFEIHTLTATIERALAPS